MKNKILQFIYDLIVPRRCTFCHKVIGFLPACPYCKDDVEKLSLGVDRCLDIKQRGLKYLDVAFACYRNDGEPRKNVLNMKFADNRFLLDTQAVEVAKLAKELPFSFDMVIPVPTNKKSLKKRGYDVTMTLAKKVSTECDIPLANDLLVKIIDTPPQHSLGYSRRRGNLSGSMQVTSFHKIANKSILVVDDILTTGSTMEYCAKLLKAYDALRVVAITFVAGEK